MAYGTVNTPGASASDLAGTEETLLESLEAVRVQTQEVSEKVGDTGDTGGSTSAGSVFGKLNKVISDLAAHMGRWTATRAGYIDTIKTDAAAAKTNTAVNNTPSDSGTLSQKMSYIISQLVGGSVDEKLETIITKTENIGIVKSVQRGTGILPYAKYTNGSLSHTVIEDAEIQINSVTPEKCIVLLNGTVSGGVSSSSVLYPPHFRSLSANTLVVGSPLKNSKDLSGYEVIETGAIAYEFSWQVIEFY